MSHWTRPLFLALVATAFLAAPAMAGTVENILTAKIASSKTLKLEDGITVKVQPSTDLRGEKGEKITFDDIPDPATFPGHVMLKVEGPKIGSTVQATKLKIQALLLN